jgi:ATP-dependent Clp protease ATP-binding subunit ClpC
MFERYTEKARRVIFFARYEASQFGQPYIQTEHLLLGLLREDKGLTNRFLRTHASVESIRKQIEKGTKLGDRISTSVDLPLSNEGKRVLAYAAEEAERLGHKHIGTEHLLLGLLREQGCFAQTLLNERGLELEKVREEIVKAATGKPAEAAKLSALGVQNLTDLYTDLTRKAAEGELEPVVARDVELEAVIEVLCRKERRNPMLLGERGAGKTAIVEALARRIANGEVPAVLRDMQVISLSAEALATLAPTREKFDDLTKMLEAVANSENLILFVDGMRGPSEATKKIPGEGLVGELKFAMQAADLQCIGATTEEEYKAVCAAFPTLDKIFRPLHVRPLNSEQALAALLARKEKLEQFHEVRFGEEALEFAVQQADSYLKEKILPGKALELLDAAAAAVKVREEVDPLPEEVTECQKKLRFIQHRIEVSVAAQEFEKARFYNEEERKERFNLMALEKRYGVQDRPASTVTPADLKQVIARWSAYPYEGEAH